MAKTKDIKLPEAPAAEEAAAEEQEGPNDGSVEMIALQFFAPSPREYVSGKMIPHVKVLYAEGQTLNNRTITTDEARFRIKNKTYVEGQIYADFLIKKRLARWPDAA